MADEIRYTVRLQVVNGQFDSGQIKEDGIRLDQAAAGASEGILPVTVAEVTLPAGSLSSRGVLFLKNLDTTNFVSWGFATGVYGARLKAGWSSLIYTLAATVVYLAADTATCEVQYRWYEE